MWDRELSRYKDLQKIRIKSIVDEYEVRKASNKSVFGFVTNKVNKTRKLFHDINSDSIFNEIKKRAKLIAMEATSVS